MADEEEEAEEWPVEGIVDSAFIDATQPSLGRKWLVKWEGYPLDRDNHWEPIHHVNNLKIWKDYERAQGRYHSTEEEEDDDDEYRSSEASEEAISTIRPHRLIDCDTSSSDDEPIIPNKPFIAPLSLGLIPKGQNDAIDTNTNTNMPQAETPEPKRSMFVGLTNDSHEEELQIPRERIAQTNMNRTPCMPSPEFSEDSDMDVNNTTNHAPRPPIEHNKRPSAVRKDPNNYSIRTTKQRMTGNYKWDATSSYYGHHTNNNRSSNHNYKTQNVVKRSPVLRSPPPPVMKRTKMPKMEKREDVKPDKEESVLRLPTEHETDGEHKGEKYLSLKHMIDLLYSEDEEEDNGNENQSSESDQELQNKPRQRHIGYDLNEPMRKKRKLNDVDRRQSPLDLNETTISPQAKPILAVHPHSYMDTNTNIIEPKYEKNEGNCVNDQFDDLDMMTSCTSMSVTTLGDSSKSSISNCNTSDPIKWWEFTLCVEETRNTRSARAGDIIPMFNCKCDIKSARMVAKLNGKNNVDVKPKKMISYQDKQNHKRGLCKKIKTLDRFKTKHEVVDFEITGACEGRTETMIVPFEKRLRTGLLTFVSEEGMDGHVIGMKIDNIRPDSLYRKTLAECTLYKIRYNQ
eukprot:807501_1